MEIIKLLLDNGANPNIKSNNGSNALFWATEAGHFEVVKLLINYIDLNHEHLGMSALIYSIYEGYYEITKFLLDNGAIINVTALIWAATKGRLEITRLLLDRGAKPNFEVSAFQPPPAIIHAVIERHIDVIKLLLERGADPNTVDFSGKSAMMFAGYDENIKKLLQKHITLNREKTEQYNIFKNPQILTDALKAIDTLTDVVKEKHIAKLIFDMKVQMEHI